MQPASIQIFAACLVACGLTIGCGSPAPEGDHGHAEGHDHDAGDGHDHAEPTSFTSALANVKAIQTEISDAFAANDTGEADHALHEAFAAVEMLGKFAKMDKLGDEKTKEIAEASEALLTAYDYLHAVHSGKEVDYSKVEGDIKAAIDRLAAVDPDHPEDHDHGAGEKEASSDEPAAE